MLSHDQDTDESSDDAFASSRRFRMVSIDVFRGSVMFLLLAEAFHFCRVAEAFPGSRIARWLCYHQTHVPWRGLVIHDLIQPGFSFLVGTALAFSIASRKRRNQSTVGLLLHAAWRAAVLILLGVFLRSMGKSQTNWTFVDTLTQIGLGYLPLVVFALLPRKTTWIAIAVILLGYFAAFAVTPLPSWDFEQTSVGVPAEWPHWEYGFAAHWNKNTNLAANVEHWLLNKFPRAEEFGFNGGGYATLSFIPTLATMLLGLVAGRWLRDFAYREDESPPTESPSSDDGQLEIESRGLAAMRLLIAGLVCLAIGYALDWSGVCISVKRIWTPSWVLVSGGWCFLILLAFHIVCDQMGVRRIFFPLIVIGMNSIVAYVATWILPDFISSSLETHFGGLRTIFGEGWSTIVSGSVVVLVIWLMLFWMHRRKLYVKI